ncbi:MAG: hypothetical protein JRD89_02905 [Deltaproteobacteria bacterium]|nr:hypothetical protein [Deltaproteobacteria bacterium]
MSPIEGVTDRVRLPRLGKIRLGVKVQGDKSPYPKAVNYFVCPPEVQAVHGEKPKELPIMFPTEEPEQWASQYYRAYSQTRGLVCKGDGRTANALVDSRTGEIATRESKETELREVTCDPDTCPLYEKKGCRAIMNLQFMLPDVPGLGVWQLDTSSWNSIRNINSAITLIKSALGRISMIPLQLKVEPIEVSPDGMKKTVYVINLHAPYTLTDIIKQLQQLPPGKFLLPTPDIERPDDLIPDEMAVDSQAAQGGVEQSVGVDWSRLMRVAAKMGLGSTSLVCRALEVRVPGEYQGDTEAALEKCFSWARVAGKQEVLGVADWREVEVK